MATSTLSTFFSKLGALSGDVTLLVVLFVIFLAFGLYFSRGTLVSVIAAFYPAMILYKTFPFLIQLTILQGDNLITINKLVIFLVFLVPLSIILDRYIFSESDYSKSFGAFRMAGLALALVVVIMIFYYSTLNFSALHQFSPQIDLLFTGPGYLFYWNLVPVALLGLL